MIELFFAFVLKLMFVLFTIAVLLELFTAKVGVICKEYVQERTASLIEDNNKKENLDEHNTI